MAAINETTLLTQRLHKKEPDQESLKIPALKSGKISLSDIIAATIGEDARLGDIDDEISSDTNKHADKTSEYCGGGSIREDLNFSFCFKENEDENFNAQTGDNVLDTLCCSDTEGAQNIVRQYQSQPECQENLNFSFYFKENHSENFNSNDIDPAQDTTCLGNINEHKNFNSKIQSQTEVTPNLSDAQSCSNAAMPMVDFKSDFQVNLSFGSEFENHDNFLNALFEGNSTNTSQLDNKTAEIKNEIGSKSSPPTNPLHDSDLEDSMHFVDPDDLLEDIKTDTYHDIPEPKTKKRRLSDVQPISSKYQDDIRAQIDSIPTFTESFNDYTNQKQSNSTFHRRRSFSGTSGHRLQRQLGASRLENQSDKNYRTPTLFRTRSFSEACNHDMLSPITEGRALDTSLSSLLGSPNETSRLSNNPFYEDLKCTLLSDLTNSATDDCPKALFDTLCQRQNSDVYARERNLQSRFSSLQSKYPDEVRDLSSFYRQQSAEVETERFREIHDERFPRSYRNHLNQHYDNLLHMIMDRVEKSLQLLSKAKQETVSVIQGFRPRPLLSRKAVSMMEEWYTRNYEHPYPSHTAVEALAAAGEITTEQVKKWFANKRNRNKNTKIMNEVVNIKRKRQFSSRW